MKIFLSKLSIAVVAVTLLVGCAVSSQEGVMETQERSGGLFGLSKKEAVEVSTAAAFSDVKKVVIAGFKVGFNDSKRLQKKSSGGVFSARSFGGKSTGLVKLDGVSSATMQAITDQAYNDFVQDLKGRGYDVVNRSTFTSSEAYDGTKEYDFPYVDDSSGMLSSYGTATYYSPSSIGSKQPVFMGEIEGVTGGFGFSNPGMAAAKFGEETGVHVLNVTYFVDFAGASGSETMTSSNIVVGQVLSVEKGVLGISSGQGGSFSSNIGSMTLGQPIGSKVSFATIEETSTDVDVGVETAMNLTSALFLRGGTNHSREFVFHADQGQYKKASLDVLNRANDMLTDKMVSLR